MTDIHAGPCEGGGRHWGRYRYKLRQEEGREESFLAPSPGGHLEFGLLSSITLRINPIVFSHPVYGTLF